MIALCTAVYEVVAGTTAPCPEGEIIGLHACPRIACKAVVRQDRGAAVEITARKPDLARLPFGEFPKIHWTPSPLPGLVWRG